VAAIKVLGDLLALSPSAHQHAFRKRLFAASEVQQVHDVSGDWDTSWSSRAAAWHTTPGGERLFHEAPNAQRYT
jgi:Lrp/AsnC family transcriptional regulator, leucine-responsive regulatory protein